MKKFLLILPLFMSVCLLCGCAHDDDASPSGVSPDAPQVSFILSLTDATPKTRATWSETYESEDGNEYENRIDPDDVQVLLYKTTGEYVANVDILSYYPLNNDSEGCEYRFVGSVTADEGELTAGKYKLMVFANCGKETNPVNPTDQSQLSDLSQLSYNYDVQLIPMWGVITPTLTLEKGKQQDLGQIDLLRAMAKVEINLDGAISGTYTITSATLSKYNTAGHCLPKDYDAVSTTTELEQETGTNPAIDTFNPYKNPSTEGLSLDISQDGKTAWLYIPEYENNTDDAATISLKVSDGTNTVSGDLKFENYVDGTATGDAHDIVRNHIYRYTVNVEAGTLTVQYKALPWNLVTSSIGYGPQPVDYKPSGTDNSNYPFNGGDNWKNFTEGSYYILLPYSGFKKDGTQSLANLFHDLYKNPKNGDVEATLSFVCRPGYNDDHDDHTVLKTGSGAARFFFMLTGPEGATWEAHLTNTEDFSFSQTPGNYFLYAKEDYADEKDHMATHGIARKDKPYIIQINANNDYTEDMVKKEGRTGCFGDEYLTDWGKKNWYGQRVVDTEFYITVRLTDGTEYELTINPSYDNAGGELQNSGKFYFKNRRRYAGTDTRIWIRQLRAQNGWGYDDLAKDIAPSTTAGTGRSNYAWWRVNPYWE